MKKKSHKCYTIVLLVFLCICGSVACTSRAITPEAEKLNSEISKAMASYGEFLETEDLYSLTAALRYPRGDSRSVYSYGDCNGDNIPELHLNGGDKYLVYTFNGQEVELFCSFDKEFYPSVIPLKDGSFIMPMRWSWDDKSDVSSQARIMDDKEQLLPEQGYDLYNWIRLDLNGDNIDSKTHRFTAPMGKALDAAKVCENNECGETAAAFLDILNDQEQRLEQQPLFPKEEWEYLDAMEEGSGLVNGLEHKAQWTVYKEILSGNFSRLRNTDERSRLYSKYENSLDENTGRSCWRYMLLDINRDGMEELLVRYGPDPLDYTDLDHSWCPIGVFFYRDGYFTWDSYEGSKECFVPLKNGQLLFMDAYGHSWNLMLGQMKEDLFNPRVIYENLIVDESNQERIVGKSQFEIYTFCERFAEYPKSVVGEGEYYFVQDCENGLTGDLQVLSAKEWSEIINKLENLMIPDKDWKPASVFPPDRILEIFSQG